jgi:hypothetical protein
MNNPSEVCSLKKETYEACLESIASIHFDTFTMTKQANQLHHDNAPAHSTALMQAVLLKHHITQICQPPCSPDLAPCHFQFFPKLKLLLKGKIFVNATITQYTSSVNGISLLTD